MDDPKFSPKPYIFYYKINKPIFGRMKKMDYFAIDFFSLKN
jgi:hypothetical protein